LHNLKKTNHPDSMQIGT